MSNEKVMNRWLIVLGAILIQLAFGAIYAWSAFTKVLLHSAGLAVAGFGFGFGVTIWVQWAGSWRGVCSTIYALQDWMEQTCFSSLWYHFCGHGSSRQCGDERSAGGLIA